MKTSTSLLSADEINLIETEGLDLGFPADLVTVGAEGLIVFTVKGIATYQHAISFYQYPGKLSDIKTVRDFDRFLFRIQALVVKASKRKLATLHFEENSNRACSAVVEAVLYGTPQQVLNTLTRSVDVGAGVSLLPSRKIRSAFMG